MYAGCLNYRKRELWTKFRAIQKEQNPSPQWVSSCEMLLNKENIASEICKFDINFYHARELPLAPPWLFSVKWVAGRRAGVKHATCIAIFGWHFSSPMLKRTTKFYRLRDTLCKRDKTSNHHIWCKKIVSSQQEAILCDGCEIWQHRICSTNITSSNHPSKTRTHDDGSCQRYFFIIIYYYKFI